MIRIEFFFYLLAGIGIVLTAFWEEAKSILDRRREEKQRLARSAPDAPFRSVMKNLDSSRRVKRMEAATQLQEYHNPECLPSLVQAADRFSKDVPFILIVIRTMESLGDERALPSLRSLTERGGPTVAKAALSAIASLEARSSLLRASQKPVETGGTLLRPAGIGAGTEPPLLLRASQKSDNSTD